MKHANYDKKPDDVEARKPHAVCPVCGEARTIGGKAPSTGIVLTDRSNGNDMIIARKGFDSIKDLKGLRVGVEKDLIEHVLLLKALEMNGMKESDVEIVNAKTDA